MWRFFLKVCIPWIAAIYFAPAWANGLGGHWNPEQNMSQENLFSKLALEAIKVDSQGQCHLDQLQADLDEIAKLAESSQVPMDIPLAELSTDELVCYNSLPLHAQGLK